MKSIKKLIHFSLYTIALFLFGFTANGQPFTIQNAQYVYKAENSNLGLFYQNWEHQFRNLAGQTVVKIDGQIGQIEAAWFEGRFVGSTMQNGSAVSGQALNPNTAINVGVFGQAESASIFGVGVYAAAPVDPDKLSDALYANGNVTVTGGLSLLSDARLKKDIQPLRNSLDLLLQLNPKQYKYKSEAYKDCNLAKGKQFGFIAQEVEQLFPELVAEKAIPVRNEKGEITDAVEAKAVNYIGLVPILVQALKEQNEVIQNQQKNLEEMLARIEKMEGKIKASSSDHSKPKACENCPAFGSEQDGVLFDNYPNPFSGNTIIPYALPENFDSAELMIFDLVSGELVRKVPLDGAGTGEYEFNYSKTGTLAYKLLVDGKIIGVRLMSCAN